MKQGGLELALLLDAARAADVLDLEVVLEVGSELLWRPRHRLDALNADRALGLGRPGRPLGHIDDVNIALPARVLSVNVHINRGAEVHLVEDEVLAAIGVEDVLVILLLLVGAGLILADSAGHVVERIVAHEQKRVAVKETHEHLPHAERLTVVEVEFGQHVVERRVTEVSPEAPVLLQRREGEHHVVLVTEGLLTEPHQVVEQVVSLLRQFHPLELAFEPERSQLQVEFTGLLCKLESGSLPTLLGQHGNLLDACDHTSSSPYPKSLIWQ